MDNREKSEQLRSRLLIAGIFIVIGISLALVIRIWFTYETGSSFAPASKEQSADTAKDETQDELKKVSKKEKALTAKLVKLKLNDATEVMNESGREMWIRTKVKTSGEQKYLDESDTVKNSPTYEEMIKGVWLLGDENYYYYTKSVKPGQKTAALINDAGSETVKDLISGYSFKAQGLPLKWIERKAGSPIEAYAVYFAH